MKAILFALLSIFSMSAFAQHKTVISTRYDDDKVIINNEFVGTGTGKIDISTISDTYTDERGVMRAKKLLAIKAMPGNQGRCGAVIVINSDDRIPKHVSLDTDLCRSSPSIDVNLN